eukprot:m.207730 g.207730  ORF g.207730 m.207730 type:complete len:116 (+) comp15030_c0_seq4:1834-2181(+)
MFGNGWAKTCALSHTAPEGWPTQLQQAEASHRTCCVCLLQWAFGGGLTGLSLTATLLVEITVALKCRLKIVTQLYSKEHRPYKVLDCDNGSVDAVSCTARQKDQESALWLVCFVL